MMQADVIGGFEVVRPDCRGCGSALTVENAWMTDGCPCNSPLGVNSMNETRWRLLMELQQRQARELEECQKYHAPRIAELERLNIEAQNRIGDVLVVIGDIEQCRCVEGDSITILCDNPEADDANKQSAVEASGDYTGYEPQRFYGRTWEAALHEAANAARRHYSE
jgi:hypothetical protein